MAEQFQFNDKNVAFVNTPDALVFAVAKTDKPYKPFELVVERDKAGKDTGWYTVPKSLVFAHRAEKLADGSRLNVMRTREVPFGDRKALFDAGVAKGLKVRAVEEKTAKPDRVHLTLETLMNGGIPVNPLHVKL